jgi:tetratricopeptide (TPR) repeat protein
MEIFQDAWPFDWSTVDIPNSPKLSRLFKRLEIECATPIPPLSLDNPDYDDPTCLSSWEIQSLYNKCIKPVDRDLNQRSPRKTVVSVETSFTNQHPHYPWRDVNAVFCGYSPEPLNEVYIFPPSQSAFHKPLKPKATAWESLETEREKLELQFAKLRKVSKLENPAVTIVMKNLAQTYEHLGKLKKAELMFRQLVDVYRRTLGPQDTRTLRECLNVIICIIARDRNNIEALSLVQNLRSELFKLVPLDNPLALDAAEVEACLAHNMGQMKKAESLDREILQMRLASEGPRHTKTISALAEFGKQISYRSTREGEIILRTALQLALEAPAVTDIKTCQIANELAHCQHRNKTQVESYRTATKAVEKYIVSLGSKHMEVIKLRRTLAWSTLFLGKVTESEELFREVLSLLSNGEIEISGRSLGSARLGLAHVLWKMDRIEEAADLYEKSFQTNLFYFPANHSTVVTTCYFLGACYEKLGRHDDALKLYHRFIDKIRESDQDLKGEIKELKSEILRIEQLKEQSTSEKSDKESSEY